MNHVGHALPADRLDGEVDVLQCESMRRDLLERKALRRELRQRQLARPVAVAARALEGDELHRDSLQRKVRELLELTLHYHRAAFALERFDPEQDGNGAGAGGAVEHDVYALGAGDVPDARERVLFINID